MLAANDNTTEQTDSAPSPASQPSWRFGDLPAAELLPQLQQYLLTQDTEANWQLVWLNNDGRPVIGLLPKISWSIYPTDKQSSRDSLNTYKVVKHCRGTDVSSGTSANSGHAITTTYMSYLEWQDELITYSHAQAADNDTSHISSQDSTKPSYHHGLVGSIGYDVAAQELSPTANIKLATQPCAVLGHYDIYLTPAEENGASVWQLKVINTSSEARESRADKQKNVNIIALTSYLDALDQMLSAKPHRQAPLKTLSKPAPFVLQARWSHNDYQHAFHQTQDYLQQGDCYQINLTQAWQGCVDPQKQLNQSFFALIDYLPSLHHDTQAPFAGYIGFQYTSDNVNTRQRGHTSNEAHTAEQKNNFELLSCSPELFFTFSKDNKTGKHHIRTKPIKGTMPRGNTTEQDNRYKQQLISSEKDRAENVMIVDLLRNDLGKYAKIGSVKVPQLFAIESFSNVHHMVSTISAELKTDTHPLAVLFGSLPAGSITGTPKKRAVEIISELESAPRGAYCGTMGYMNFDGSGQWNVLIRTIQANLSSDNGIDQEGHVSLWAGGGITVASDCDAEYQECLDKVGNLLSVLAQTT
ncbi:MULTISPECIES: anthranilate synthase component I family protein [Psychrobacter]|uniref:anthranilate synthase component I family protein n=1 Tax=Psychrobacter TaxID=497 RepID=UPI000EEE9970|nr:MULTISPECIES: anthranilate synthase component I family protein [Psychrobacter]HCN17753.1 aminodeoxychorismate synthase component I [Psychrobacter sp.]